ncbi:hypothetical protein EVG20_g5470 [Dentipellis fragilis]|uniref:Uncharacterized protein n=1 Tax=Dentipellis fragilis TaxID=205917 RepID=A0A4Y9YST1_9AGAM|nr:hypothetical protein EVG20_g5470 [Dentipellis fragilis]
MLGPAQNLEPPVHARLPRKNPDTLLFMRLAKPSDLLSARPGHTAIPCNKASLQQNGSWHYSRCYRADPDHLPSTMVFWTSRDVECLRCTPSYATLEA